jgi:hypothetical protein
VGLDNPIIFTLAGFKDFLRLFIRFGDHGATLDQVLWFLFQVTPQEYVLIDCC